MFAYCGNNSVNNVDPSGTCYYNAKEKWCHDNWEYLEGREIGGTLLKIGSKYKNIRFDVGSKSMFHMNVQLSKKINLHLPLSIVGSGFWGGMMRD